MAALQEDSDLINVIKKKLNASKDARTVRHTHIGDIDVPIEADLVIEDGPDKFFIEVKTRPRIDTLGRLVLLRELINKSGVRNYKINLVVASKAFSRSIEEIADKTNIRLIELPGNMKLSGDQYYKESRNIKITSIKAWSIVTRLMKEKITSIRQLSLKEDVSYGWTHAVIQHLLNQEIVSRTGNYVEISNIDKLLNGIGWERQFENLKKGEIVLRYNSSFEAARDITYILKKKDVGFAFTSYTAGSLYTGYAVRHDSLYLYLDKENIRSFAEIFPGQGKEGIKVNIYRPDRDVFNDQKKLEDINIVSPEQALLDLAGTGYAGRDLASEMVNRYGSL